MSEVETAIAVAVNVIIYSLLGVGLWRYRRQGRTSPEDPPAVFRRLERVLTKAYPESRGDTLREMLARARSSYPMTDWSAVMRELDEYEGYKFGGHPVPASSRETLRLARSIRERRA